MKSLPGRVGHEGRGGGREAGRGGLSKGGPGTLEPVGRPGEGKQEEGRVKLEQEVLNDGAKFEQ